MTTAQTLIDEARNTLQDADKVRFPDVDLLVGLNDGLKLMRAMRPDLWFGTLGTPLAALTLVGTFPLGTDYEVPVKKYIVHYASMRDDEYVAKGRGDAFLQQFTNELFKAG